MKKAKKILLLILCVLLLNINVVYGAEATSTLKAVKDVVKPGETVEVKLNVNCEEGVTAVVTNIEYDKTILTLEKLELADGWMNFGTNEKLEILINKQEKMTQLDVCTITFKVSETAKEGTTKINTTAIQVSDITGNSNNVEAQEKIIKIKLEEKPNDEIKKLESIEITKKPSKLEYKEGEKFDAKGMEVTAKYTDGTSKKVENYTISPSVNLKTENTDITISYTEDGITKTATQKIKVVKVQDNPGNTEPGNTNPGNTEPGNTNSGNKVPENTTSGNTVTNLNNATNNNKVVTTNKVNTQKNDSTLANKVIPAAGEKMIIIPLGIISVLAIVSYVKYKKYKND